LTKKPFPWKCGKCRSRAVFPAVVATYATELEHDGRKYPIALQDFHVLRCRECETILLDDEANRRLSHSLRVAVGLLQPEEIRERRVALSLKQKDLANLLQISESTLSRWETGAQIQQRCMDRLLRAFFDLPALRDYLWDFAPSVAGAAESPLASPLPPPPQGATHIVS
jgi:putative zinc finger/helix-turn-helix YgiT family protein